MNDLGKYLMKYRIDDDREAKASLTLITCIIICCKGHIDELIPHFMMV